MENDLVLVCSVHTVGHSGRKQASPAVRQSVSTAQSNNHTLPQVLFNSFIPCNQSMYALHGQESQCDNAHMPRHHQAHSSTSHQETA
jgi:hypothetical protein